jgi:hypothetical protein
VNPVESGVLGYPTKRQLATQHKCGYSKVQTTDFNASLYFGPSFSNSAKTQSEMVGMPRDSQLTSIRPGGHAEKRGLQEAMAIWRTFCHQTVHHPLHQLDLILDREIDEVRID